MNSAENPPTRSRRRSNGGCLSSLVNLITIAILLFGLLLVLAVGAFFFAPDQINGLLENSPLAALFASEENASIVPPTAAAVAIVPTATITPLSNAATDLQPTWTPLATAAASNSDETSPVSPASATETPSATPTFPTFTPTPTHTPTPTLTPTPSDTPTATPIGPTATPSPTRSSFPFTKSDDSPIYGRNFANNAGCGWLGIAGEVLDINRNPVPRGSYVVHVWDSGVNERVEAGSAPAYGPSGWEQFVFNSIVIRTYKVQLETPQGTPVSQVYTVQTRASCNENLLRVIFVQNH